MKKLNSHGRLRLGSVIGAVVVAGATLGGVVSNPARATIPSGCEVGPAVPDSHRPPSLDLVSGGWIDTTGALSNPTLSATFAVTSLAPNALPPAGSVAERWTMDFTNNIGNNPGANAPAFLNHPYFQVTLDAAGNWTGTMGFVRAGQQNVWQPATVTVTPGSPGYIQISRDTNTFGVGEFMPLQNFHTTTELIGSMGATTVDEVGPYESAYLSDVATHQCVDFATPAQPTALRAADLLDSIGVNTHFDFAGFQDHVTRPGTWTALENALLDLGIHHIRETKSGTPAVHDELARLGSLGVKTDLVFWQPSQSPSGADALAYIKTLLPGAIDAVEGDNEPNDTSPTISDAQRFQKELWTAMQGDPATKNIPVGTPAVNVSMPATFKDLGNLSAYASYGALHAYPGTEPISRRLYMDFMMQKQQSQVSGTLPQWVTEAGWDNFVSGAYAETAPTLPQIDNSLGTGVSERAQAAYLTKTLLTDFALGMKRSYLYELIDEGALTVPTSEDYYGLIRPDFTPKPVYGRLKTLNRLLTDAGTVTTPGVLTNSVSPSTVQHVLMQKSDGSYWLALWKDARLYSPEPSADNPLPHDLYPGPTTASVSLGSSLWGTQYQLANGTTAVKSLGNASTFTVSVPADDVALVQLTALPPVAAPAAIIHTGRH